MSLADEDDEVKLVLMLRAYASRHRARRTQVVVVFDHGVYGHPQRLGGGGVVCVFARSPEDADEQIRRRIAALARPQEWALVTADRALARAGAERGLRVLDSRRFAGELTAPARRQGRGRPARKPEKGEAPLSAAEVEEWLRLFGEAPEEEDQSS